MSRCPRSWAVAEAAEEAALYRDWQWLTRHRVMPCAGGLLEQPARWVDGVEVIDSEVTRLEAARGNQQANALARDTRRR